jgi:Domain of unknown function (DUF4166)
MTAVYRRALGLAFDYLPSQVRALHDVTTSVTWAGRADVVRGETLAARAIATLFGLPPAGLDQPLSVTFGPIDGAEVWTRTFGAETFVSTQRAVDGVIHETVGACVLVLRPNAGPDDLTLTLERASLLGVPLPRFLLPKVRTREFERDGFYWFEVEARVPAFGLLVRYRGWLHRANAKIGNGTGSGSDSGTRTGGIGTVGQTSGSAV